MSDQRDGVSELNGPMYPSVWLVLMLAAVGWTAANPGPLILMLPLLSLAMFGGYRCRIEVRRWAKMMRWFMVGLGFLIALPLLLSSRLLMGMLIFIFFMLLAVGFTLRQRREVYMLLLGSVGLILYSASYAPTTLFHWLIPFWLLSVVWVMMQLNGARVRAGTRSLSLQGGFLAVVPVALFILSLTALLFWLLPRPEALQYEWLEADTGLIYDDDSWAAQARAAGGRQGEAEAAGSAPGSASLQGDAGLAREPRLGTGPVEEKPPRLLLQVESDHPVLLRTLVFDHYEGGSWRRSTGRDRYRQLAAGRFERPLLAGEAALRQRIEVMAEMEGVIPHLPTVQKMELPSRVLREDHLGNLYLPDRLQPGTIYTVYSVLDRINGRVLFPERQPDVLGDYLQLPLGHDQLCQRASELGASREPLAAAQQIERYLIDEVPGVEQPESRGLMEALERGMLPLQRLSAFVLMQRCLGVPARLVSGYHSALQHPLTGRYQVSSHDGTVWAEVWLERTGWLRFVVNPSSAETVADGWLESAREYIEQRLLHADLGVAERVVLLLALHLVDLLITLRDVVQAAPLMSALLGGLLLCGLWLLWSHRHRVALFWLSIRLQRRLGREPEQAAIWLFAALEHWFARLGQARQTHETARQYVLRLQRNNPQLDSLPSLLEAFHQQRYGNVRAPGVFSSADAAVQFWRGLRLVTTIREGKL